MRVLVIDAAEPILTPEEVKAHLRIGHDEDNAYITGLIEAASQWIGAPTGWLGRSLGLQTLELYLDGFYQRGCAEIMLPGRPVKEVLAVSYYDADGAWHDIDPAGYGLLVDFGLYPKPGFSWPTCACTPSSVRIRYSAGYAPEDVPAPIKQAMLLLIGHWYAQREAAVEKPLTATPFAVEALLSPFRVWS